MDYGDENMKRTDDEDAMDEDTEEENAVATTERSDYFADRVSMDEYKKITKEYTDECVTSLVQSREFQRRNTTCCLCWCAWSEGQCNQTCLECGGFAMQRPCPICDARCHSIWQRDVDLSHSQNEAHWNGECGLDWKEREGFIYQKLMDDTQSEIWQDIGQLSTDA